MNKNVFLIASAAVAMLVSLLAFADSVELEFSYTGEPVSTEDLLQGTDKTDGWLMYGGNYNNWRYSPLDGINKENVNKLTPVWMFQTGLTGQLSGSPIVADGVMYISAPYNNLWALDARTGEVIWHFEHDMPSDVILCCGPANRGVAIKDDLLFMATLDAKLLAIQRSNGEVAWTAKLEDYKKGYSGTSSPLIVGDMVVTGIAGGEYGARGFVDAYDTDTGKMLWRRYTVPSEGEKGVETWAGDSWKTGGGPTWAIGTYDPQSNTLYWPVGNPSPDWNGDVREGDNLYTNSVLALEPETGEMKWYFQFTPHDMWDYDATNGLVIDDIVVDGKTVRALMQPNRNGYVYVLDATTGAYIKAFQYTDRLTWSTGLDGDGRPQVNPEAIPKAGAAGDPVCPGLSGGHNGSWSYSYSKSSQLMYVPSVESCMGVFKEDMVYIQGIPFWGGGPSTPETDDGSSYGILAAIDPVAGEVKWKYRSEYPFVGGALATAGGVVFSGDQEGYAFALDDATGDELWKFQTGSSIRSQPITWQIDGTQYVAIGSGMGGLVPGLSGAPEKGTNGNTLLVFAVPETKTKWFWQ
mgnify:FL=1